MHSETVKIRKMVTLTLDQLIQHGVDVRRCFIGHHPTPSGHLQPAIFHQSLHDHLFGGVSTVDETENRTSWLNIDFNLSNLEVDKY